MARHSFCAVDGLLDKARTYTSTTVVLGPLRETNAPRKTKPSYYVRPLAEELLLNDNCSEHKSISRSGNNKRNRRPVSRFALCMCLTPSILSKKSTTILSQALFLIDAET